MEALLQKEVLRCGWFSFVLLIHDLSISCHLKENNTQIKLETLSLNEAMDSKQNTNDLEAGGCWKKKRNPFNSIWLLYFLGFLGFVGVAVLAYIGLYHVINCK